MRQLDLLTGAPACACANIRKASRAITQLYDAVLQPSGLRVTQYTLLATVALVAAPTISHLAERMVIDRTTLARDLKLLERQGVVAITVGDDQRTRIVTLTEAGWQALARAAPLWEQAQSRVVAGLGEERWRALRAELSAVVTLAREWEVTR